MASSTGVGGPSRRANKRNAWFDEASGGARGRNDVDDDEIANFLGTNPRSSDSTSFLSEAKMARVMTVAPLPDNIPSYKVVHAWRVWRKKMEASFEESGLTDQRRMALRLSLSLNEALQTLVTQEEWLRPVSKVPAGFRFYDYIVHKIDDHLETLADPTVYFSAMNNVVQGDDESTYKYEQRVRKMALDAGDVPYEFIKTKLIDGLRDKDLAERAMVQKLDIREIVLQGTRIESMKSSAAAKESSVQLPSVPVSKVDTMKRRLPSQR